VALFVDVVQEALPADVVTDVDVLVTVLLASVASSSRLPSTYVV
jgi:hypothetical protein